MLFMKTTTPDNNAPGEFRLDPEAVCDACGCYGAFRFETETLCTDCYAHRGSCCSAEFSGRPAECKRTNPPDDSAGQT